MPAPAGAFCVFPHCRSGVYSRRSLFCISPRRSSDCSLYLYFITTAVVTAPLRSTICISPLPQQCPLPQERYLYISSLPQQCSLQQEPFLLPAPPRPTLPPPNCFPTAAAVPAPAGAFSVFPHCRSGVYSRRSLFCISPRRSSDCSSRSAICISSLPQ